jgi:hypothetical protein
MAPGCGEAREEAEPVLREELDGAPEMPEMWGVSGDGGLV